MSFINDMLLRDEHIVEIPIYAFRKFNVRSVEKINYSPFNGVILRLYSILHRSLNRMKI